jgi:hypothetical protein
VLENVQRGPQSSVRILEELVPVVSYKDWTFTLLNRTRTTEHYAGGEGLTLEIRAKVKNSLKPDEFIKFCHLMPIPPANWDWRAWERWMLDQILLVEQHETCEFFTVGDRKPFFPAHGAGGNGYEIRRVV